MATGVIYPSNISAGYFHSAVVIAGYVLTYGLNSSGQLGNGTTTTSYIPVQVTGYQNY
ncbi:MAG: hypothetical protein HY606_03630 [Planctomycetes bacterium]|nr:hypothetical protein [Planctomycetota bacterium]